MRDEWLIFGGGPTVVEYKDKLIKFMGEKKPVVVGTNWMPEWVKIDYHVISNRKNLERYKSNLRGTTVGASKIKNLSLYVDVDNKYPASKGYFKVGKIIKMAGGTVAMYALAFAVQNHAKTVYFAGLDGFRNGLPTHWYRTEENLDRAAWQQGCTTGILRDASKMLDLKIITPTVHYKWYDAGVIGYL